MSSEKLSYPLTKVDETSYIEGYWRSSYEKNYPFPKPTDQPVDSDFLSALKDMMSTNQCNLYRGFSFCRLCNECNGSGEYQVTGTLDNLRVQFTFPDGILHYYTEHNVQPSKEFKKFVLDNSKP
jgi:hypothetical protein